MQSIPITSSDQAAAKDFSTFLHPQFSLSEEQIKELEIMFAFYRQRAVQASAKIVLGDGEICVANFTTRDKVSKMTIARYMSFSNMLTPQSPNTKVEEKSLGSQWNEIMDNSKALIAIKNLAAAEVLVTIATRIRDGFIEDAKNEANKMKFEIELSSDGSLAKIVETDSK